MIAVLGEGITGTAAKEKLSEMGLYTSDLTKADWIVTSPGIPPEQFPKTSVEIVSEIEAAYRLFEEKPVLIGVTGTNGKSTVTALLAHVLQVPYCGNIGIPLISYVGKKEKALVVELSSYQLEQCFSFKPHISIFMNLTQDHMQRHKTMAEYGRQKAKIFQNQGLEDYLIYYEDDHYVRELAAGARCQRLPFSLRSPEKELLTDFHLVGPHNQLNAIAVIKAARLMGLDDATLKKRISTFQPLEHRLIRVLEYQGRVFYNDSKATNPDSTVVAVESFKEPIHLILCGFDKGLELEDFAKFLVGRVKTITVFGDIAKRMAPALKQIDPNFPVFQESELTPAVQRAFQASQRGDVILFSPSCSSFDQFKDFNHRGEQFNECLKKNYGLS